jgi:peptidoglycan hydrolase CwlO-like protein|tara:strand:+ start:663 stop:914 length:252 start_codon:yes stop_codon:yes gene_type:complete
MIDKKISIGSILTIITVASTIVYTHGANATKLNGFEAEQTKSVRRIDKNEEDITDLKVSVGKIETQLDNRFDRIEDLLFELSD